MSEGENFETSLERANKSVGAAVPQVLMLVCVSCILSLLIGGMSRGRPFDGTAAAWAWLAAVILWASIIALFPLGVTFLASFLIGKLTAEGDVKRSCRDGLAAAWFFIFAVNVAMWSASDLMKDLASPATRPHVRSVFE